MKVPDLFVGKRLFVGCMKIPSAALGAPGPGAIRGSAYVEGPVLVGTPLSFSSPEANLMVARCDNVEALPPPLSILKVSSRGLAPTPIDVILGDPSGPVGINCFCGPMPFVVKAAIIDLNTIKYLEFATNKIKTGVTEDIGAKVFSGAKVENGVDSNTALAYNAAPIIGDAPFRTPDYKSAMTTLNRTFKIAISKKSFDIQHPTKKDHRLRYICLEGPAAEVYVRGTLVNENVINLPDHWRGLVDQETIGVSLTPIGVYQELFVEKIEYGSRIIIKNNAGGPINCYYTITAERKDVEKNIPEYKGLTPADYPGDNSNYNINGF